MKKSVLNVMLAYQCVHRKQFHYNHELEVIVLPRLDGTGPMGMGAMTGRGAGFCNAVVNSEISNQPIYFGGYGFGYGRGFRREFCVKGAPSYFKNNFPRNSVEMDEKTLLSNQETLLENQLKQVKDRLSRLGKESE